MLDTNKAHNSGQPITNLHWHLPLLEAIDLSQVEPTPPKPAASKPKAKSDDQPLSQDTLFTN